MNDTIYQDVKSVIVDVLKTDPEKVSPEARIVEDLKADSMDQFFLIDGLCEKFNLTISDDEARSIKTVSDAVKFIESHK